MSDYAPMFVSDSSDESSGELSHSGSRPSSGSDGVTWLEEEIPFEARRENVHLICQHDQYGSEWTVFEFFRYGYGPLFSYQTFLNDDLNNVLFGSEVSSTQTASDHPNPDFPGNPTFLHFDQIDLTQFSGAGLQGSQANDRHDPVRAFLANLNVYFDTVISTLPDLMASSLSTSWADDQAVGTQFSLNEPDLDRMVFLVFIAELWHAGRQSQQERARQLFDAPIPDVVQGDEPFQRGMIRRNMPDNQTLLEPLGLEHAAENNAFRDWSILEWNQYLQADLGEFMQQYIRPQIEACDLMVCPPSSSGPRHRLSQSFKEYSSHDDDIPMTEIQSKLEDSMEDGSEAYAVPKVPDDSSIILSFDYEGIFRALVDELQSHRTRSTVGEDPDRSWLDLSQLTDSPTLKTALSATDNGSPLEDDGRPLVSLLIDEMEEHADTTLEELLQDESVRDLFETMLSAATNEDVPSSDRISVVLEFIEALSDSDLKDSDVVVDIPPFLSQDEEMDAILGSGPSNPAFDPPEDETSDGFSKSASSKDESRDDDVATGSDSSDSKAAPSSSEDTDPSETEGGTSSEEEEEDEVGVEDLQALWQDDSLMDDSLKDEMRRRFGAGMFHHETDDRVSKPDVPASPDELKDGSDDKSEQDGDEESEDESSVGLEVTMSRDKLLEGLNDVIGEAIDLEGVALEEWRLSGLDATDEDGEWSLQFKLDD